MLLGTAASGVLLLELFNYVLTNFGINLFYTASVPFLSYGLTGTVANSILVGILLGSSGTGMYCMKKNPAQP